ncbi:MAG TPA: argininosuccinate lyase [Actinomycetota bacterium]|nr:argininosuccinate lyase [Actinomycetota bacterium]
MTRPVGQATEAGPSPDAPAPELVEAGFALEIADAPLLHRGLNLADLAHLLVLGEAGVVPAPAAARVLQAILAVHRDIPPEAFPYDAALGDPYNSREAYFADRLGDDAGWLHAGRPRREAGRVALRLHLRGTVTELAAEAAGFGAAVAQVARTHAGTVMADQTYLQQAQPSTFGHYLLAFAYPVLRDAGRLLEAADWVNRSPGGAGCVNGSRLGLDRLRTAQLLGFDGFIAHTRDAMWQIDGLIDILATAASLVSTLSKLAEDLEIWDSQEFDFVDLAGAYTRASVLMPQKRNPYALSIVRGAAGVLIGRLSGFLAVVKTPSARTDNLIFAYGEIPRAVELAAKVTRLMTGVVRTLRVHPDRMWEALEAGFSQATDLAEFVMQACGVDYRTAYLVVGGAVRTAARRGLRGVDLTADMLDEAAVERLGRPLGLGSRDLSEVLDPRSIVSTRASPGGAAPAAVEEMVAEVLADAEHTRRSAEERREGFRSAEAALVGAAEAVATA